MRHCNRVKETRRNEFSKDRTTHGTWWSVHSFYKRSDHMRHYNRVNDTQGNEFSKGRTTHGAWWSVHLILKMSYHTWYKQLCALNARKVSPHEVSLWNQRDAGQ